MNQTAAPVRGPYRIVGRTIVGAPQPRRDDAGRPIPGAFTEPSVCEVMSAHAGPETDATAELLRSSWELQAQRNELAGHLRNAVNFIEHAEGSRRVMFDAASLRQLLDAEIRQGNDLTVSYGFGRERTSARFDLAAARLTLSHVADDGCLPGYAQLYDLVGRLSNALQDSADQRLAADPREPTASKDNALAAEAFSALGKSLGVQTFPISDAAHRNERQHTDTESGSSLRP